MTDAFFQSPILNSPYEQPSQHWELDDNGQPTSVIVRRRRQSALVSPIPKARKVRGKAAAMADLLADAGGEEYNPTKVINRYVTDQGGGNPTRLDFALPDHGVEIEAKRFHSPRIAEQMARADNVIVAQGEAAVAFLAAAIRATGKDMTT